MLLNIQLLDYSIVEGLGKLKVTLRVTMTHWIQGLAVHRWSMAFIYHEIQEKLMDEAYTFNKDLPKKDSKTIIAAIKKGEYDLRHCWCEGVFGVFLICKRSSQNKAKALRSIEYLGDWDFLSYYATIWRLLLGEKFIPFPVKSVDINSYRALNNVLRMRFFG